jgi:hypothetical protein
MRKSSGNKRFKDFHHSSSSLSQAITLNPNLNNVKNNKQTLYPYENQIQTSIKDKKMKNLRYDSFKRKYTIHNDGIVANNNIGQRLSNNFVKPNAKMSQSLNNNV